MAEAKNFFLSLKQDGILGDSVETNHVGWMASDSWSFQMSQSADISTGKQAGAGTAATGSFSFDRIFDKSSGPLFDRCSRGQVITQGTFEAQRAGGMGSAGGGNPLASEPGPSSATGDVSRVYFKLVFKNLVVTHRGVRWHDEDTGTESIGFAFGEVQMAYLQVATTGALVGSPIQKTYNAKENRVT